MPALQETTIVAIYLGFIAGFLLYHAIGSSPNVKKYIFSKSSKGNISRNHVLIHRMTGFFSFFILPAAIIFLVPDATFNELGIIPTIQADTIIFSLLIAIPLVLLSYITSKSPVNLLEYPQIRNAEWNPGLLVISGITWILYLFAYEFTFRGILLFSLIEALGILPAIILNITIYALVHVPKNLREAIGAVPLGFVLCLAAWKTGNFMVAFIAHCSLALSNEWFSLYNHPEMQLKHIKK